MALPTADFFVNPAGVQFSSSPHDDSSSSGQSNSPSHSSSGNSPMGSGPAPLLTADQHKSVHRNSTSSNSSSLFDGLSLTGGHDPTSFNPLSFDSNKDAQQRQAFLNQLNPQAMTRSGSTAGFELEMGEDGEDDDNDDSESGKKDKDSGSKAGTTKQAQTSAERRATHNAIERARRESLNGRFMQLAQSLPSMANVKRPSKSIIVNKSLEYIQESVVREHNLLKENAELRREVDELRSRLGMPPLPPATPAAFAAHLPVTQQMALAQAHVAATAAPGAATIPPELPNPALQAFRPYAITGAGVVPMHSAGGHHHPGLHLPLHRPNISMMAPHPYSLTSEAAALLSPAVFHPHTAQPQPHVMDHNPFDASSQPPQSAPQQPNLHPGYAGAIMGNPPAMSQPLTNGSGQVTPKAQGSKNEKDGDSGKKGAKRTSPGAEEPENFSNKKAKSSNGKQPVAPHLARSNSVSSNSSASSGSASSAHNTSPFMAHSEMPKSSGYPSLSALGLDPSTLTNSLGLVNPGGIFGSHAEQGGLLSAAHSSPGLATSHPGWLSHVGISVEGAPANGANPFGLFGTS